MKKNPIHMNIMLLILVFLGIETIINDVFAYLCTMPYWLTTIISLGISCLLFFFFRKNIKIKKDFDKSDIIFFIFLIFLLIIHIPFADEMYDTINYHLYLQERPFISKLYQDFFPGRYINTFSYAFPDRMFYFFRYFLGYRLGVILNYIILGTLYYQCKNIIKKCLNIKPIYITILSIIVVLNLSILEQIDNYYVDLLSLVFLLELFNLAFDQEENSFFLKTCLYFLVCGMAFSVKVSNAFFIILFSLLYLFNHIKEIKKMKWWHSLVFMILFIFPVGLYMFYTFLETGNPVFPFYNTIFKSSYYPLENWMDDRFGPKSIIEWILWPVLSFFYPERVADTKICEPMWGIGYIVAIASIVVCLFKKLKKQDYSKKYFQLSMVTIILYVVWSKFLLGYTRYAIVVVLLGNIVTILALYKLLANKKYMTGAILAIGIFVNFAYTAHYYMFSNYSLFYDNITNSTLENYKYNMKHLFDKNEELIRFPENSCWGVINENAGELLMINNKVDILNLTWGAATTKSSEILNKNLEKYDHIYTAVKYTDLEYFFNRINEFGIDIITIYDTVIPSNIENIGFYYVFEIGYGKQFDNYSLFYESIEKEVVNVDNDFYIGSHPYIRDNLNDYYVSIYGIKEGSEILIKKEYKNSSEHGVNIKLLNIQFDQIKIQIENKEGEILPLNMILINY